MRKVLLSLAAVALVSAASFAPASAMTPGTASGMRAAIQDVNLIEDVAWVCQHRGWRRTCWKVNRHHRHRHRHRHW